MSAVASASLCWTLLSVSLLLVSAEQKTITAESGQNVTLTCRAPNNNITVLEWSRADLGDENVLLYHNDCFDPVDQHPSFKNRVDLQDRQMKDGDVSLILKNVTINDAGTYECRVITTGTIRRKGANLGVSIIHLHVDPPGQTRGSVGLKVGLSVSAVLLVVVAVVGFLIYKRKQQQSVETNQPPVEVQQAEISQRFFQH